MQKKILLLLFIFLQLNMVFCQSWEENFYDSQILYQNPELLQLTENEIRLLKIKNMEKSFKKKESLNNNYKAEMLLFLDFEKENLSSVQIQEMSKQSFQDVAHNINIKRITKNASLNNL